MAVITPCYLDTSAAIKIIDQGEAGAGNLAEFLKRGRRSLISSVLLKIELQSYVRRIRRDTSIDQKVAEYFETLTGHLLSRIILRPINPDQIELAAGYMQESEVKGRLRSLDAIHFASFSEFAENFAHTVLISADDTLIELAQEHKRECYNPLTDEIHAGN